MADQHHKNKLRRLRLLQYLNSVAPSPVGERALLNYLLTDRELEPTISLVRQSLEYLASEQMVTMIAVDHVDWCAASITDSGSHWLSEDSDFDLDIYSPSYEPPDLPDAYHGRTSNVDLLPTETRAWIDQQLLNRNFTGYSDLTALLKQQGLKITRSSLGRYAVRLKKRVSKYREKADMIKSLSTVFGDDAPAIMQGAMGTAVTAVLDAIEDGEYSAGKETLSSLVKALPALGRGFHDAEKHKIEQEARRQTIEEAANVGEEAARAQGLDDDQARFWREKFLKGM